MLTTTKLEESVLAMTLLVNGELRRDDCQARFIQMRGNYPPLPMQGWDLIKQGPPAIEGN